MEMFGNIIDKGMQLELDLSNIKVNLKTLKLKGVGTNPSLP